MYLSHAFGYLLNLGASLALRSAGWFVGRSMPQSLAEMNKAQWLPPSELNARMEKRLTGLLQYAATRVPFYREHLKAAGVRVEDVRGLAGLRLFPIVNKFTFRDRFLDPFLAENVAPHRKLSRRTSGSTGEPFAHYVDREALPVIYASHLFYDSWYDLRPFDRQLRISPPRHGDPGTADAPTGARLRQHLTASLKRMYEGMTQGLVSIWEVDLDGLELVAGRIAGFKPDYLLGYTSTLAMLADHLQQRPRGVITIGETLTPARRKLIAGCFGVPIINRYGLREFGAWSAQNCVCSDETFHINTEMVTLEVLRGDGSSAAPGESGKVIITDLHNHVMPFIRYDTSDFAVQGNAAPCPCGRGFPRLGAIEGRSVESLTTVSGRTVSSIILGRYLRDGGPLFKHIDHTDHIRHYQAIQEGDSRVRFMVVPGPGFDERRSALLREDLARLLGSEMEVVIETVDRIPLEKSGKRPLIKRAPVEAV